MARSRLTRLVVLCVLSLAAGCTQSGALHVVVEGAFESNLQVDTLILEVTRESNGERLLSDTVTGQEFHGLPYSYNIVSGPSAPNGTVLRVRARALRNSVVLAEQSGVGTLRSEGVSAESGLRLNLAAGMIDQLPGTPSSDGGTQQPPASGGCASNAQCSATQYCRTSDGVCVDKKAAAAQCAQGSECASGNCADGVCCNSACDGPCDVCNAQGSAGTCTPLSSGALGLPSCAPYYCSGSSGSCATRCTTDAQCASGVCTGGVCVGKKGLGQSCARADECSSSFCASGVCCNSACTGSCATCSATPGTCTNVAAGSVGSPSCAPYACAGNAPTCATTCGSGLSCAPGYTCSGTTCLAKFASLRDDFQDNVRDDTKWALFTKGTSAAAAERNGRLEVTLTGGSSYAGYTSKARYDLVGSSATIQVASAGNQSINSLEMSMRLQDGDNEVVVIIRRNLVLSALFINGTYTEIASTSYSSTNHRYLRLRENGGTLFWQASSDNINWTNLAQRPVSNIPFSLTGLVAHLENGAFQAEAGLSSGSPSNAAYEAFNP